jgi:chitodextrinase
MPLINLLSQTMSRAWSATVAKEVLQSTPNKEIARQEAIHELIYTEEDYVRDLNLLDEVKYWTKIEKSGPY